MILRLYINESIEMMVVVVYRISVGLKTNTLYFRMCCFLTATVRALYANSLAFIPINNNLSNWFDIDIGVQ